MPGRRKTFHQAVYDLFSPLYDLGFYLMALPLGGEARLRGRVIEALGPVKNLKVLEIFAGTASLSVMAARLGANAYAFDLSSGMLKVAGEKAGKVASTVRLVRGDAEMLPFADASFDRVIVSMGLHEAGTASIEPILGEAMRALRSGGRLVIFDYHGAEGFAGTLQRLFFVFTEGDSAWSWLRLDLQGLLSKTGFRNFRRIFLARRAFQIVTAEKK